MCPRMWSPREDPFLFYIEANGAACGGDDFLCRAIMVDMAVGEDDLVDIGAGHAQLPQGPLEDRERLQGPGVKKRHRRAGEEVGVHRPRLFPRQGVYDPVDAVMYFCVPFFCVVGHVAVIPRLPESPRTPGRITTLGPFLRG